MMPLLPRAENNQNKEIEIQESGRNFCRGNLDLALTLWSPEWMDNGCGWTDGWMDVLGQKRKLLCIY